MKILLASVIALSSVTPVLADDVIEDGKQQVKPVGKVYIEKNMYLEQERILAM